jgi:hypothetical protein
MKNFSHAYAVARRRLPLAVSAGLLATTALFGASFVNAANAADPDIQLGTASSFSVLAGSGITNTGSTTVEGHIGSYETPSITGDSDITFITGQNHAGDGVTQQAKTDLLVAYNTAAGAQPPTAIPEELTRIQPYLPGVYRASSSMLLSGAMTLDGGGRSDGVFVFQAPSSTITTASNSSVLFVNGAQPCNVYWQIGSSATFGTGTSFVGNVLAHTSITANTNATFEGRLLANNGAVTLQSNTISAPACDVVPGGGGGTDTDATAGTGTDTDSTAGTGTDTDSTAGTGTDTDATAGTDSGTSADVSTATDSGTDTDSIGTAASSTDTATPELPDTGGSPIALVITGAVLLFGGASVVAAARMRRGTR